MPFITIFSADKRLHGIHETATAAAAAVVAGVEVVAGKQVLPNGAAPDIFYWHADTTSVTRATPPRAPVLTDLHAAGRAMLGAFSAWRAGLDREAYGQTDAEQAKGHAYLRFALEALYIILRDADIPISTRVAIATSVGYGATNTTSAIEFYSHSLTLTAPTGPALWVNAAGERLTLENIRLVDGTPPASSVNLSDLELDNRYFRIKRYAKITPFLAYIKKL